jgi:hypothetical protein
MVSERQIRKVIEGAGYKVNHIEGGRHFKVDVAGRGGRTIRIVVSNSPRSQSHWPQFVLADIKRRMR